VEEAPWGKHRPVGIARRRGPGTFERLHDETRVYGKVIIETSKLAKRALEIEKPFAETPVREESFIDGKAGGVKGLGG
jgi:hypothetical protein